jgi:hypothetical protein
VFEDCVAAFEVINCQSVQAQTTGKVATVSIDKVDGCQVYLSVGVSVYLCICVSVYLGGNILYL